MDSTRPYASAAMAYRRAGWTCPLPLPVRRKASPPQHYTGWAGLVPSGADVQAWADGREGDGNIALRMPDDVIVIDVDAYSGKPASERFASLGLGVTWTSTSRGADSDARHHFYRYDPADLAGRVWDNHPTGPDSGLDSLHFGHRYSMVWPSVHPSGDVVTWYDLEREAYEGVPEKTWLTVLTREQVHAMSHEGAALTGDAATRAEVQEFLAAWHERAQPPCTPVLRAVTRERERFARVEQGEALHQPAPLYHLVSLGLEGHAGVYAALVEHLETHVRVATATGRRTEADAGAEWWRMVLGAVGKKLASTGGAYERKCECRADLGAEDPAVAAEEGFWTARPALGEIRRTARQRMVGPWATLGCVLAHVAAQVGPHVQLPAIIGGRASLNVFVALVGPSGSGKDAAQATARDLLRTDYRVPIHEAGTGQGIDSAYTTYDRKKKEPVQFCDSALFTISEIDTLDGHSKMSGSTIMPTLRKVYTGATLGARYADPEKRRPVREHTYRAAVVAGVQPGRSGILINDAVGGTPQRWLWLPTNDPDWAPDEEPENPFGPTAGHLVLPGDLQAIGEIAQVDRECGANLPNRPPVEIKVCETARTTIVDNRVVGHTSALSAEGRGLDGHALLTRLKVAALLALYDGGRAEVLDEDWDLAGIVMQVSDGTRSECVRVLDETAKRQNRARAEAEADRNHVISDADRVRVAVALKRTLDRKAEWVPRGDLRRSLPGRDRPDFEVAIDRLIDAGQVRAEETQSSCRYRSV